MGQPRKSSQTQAKNRQKITSLGGLDDFLQARCLRPPRSYEQQEPRSTMVVPKHILGTFDDALTSLRKDLLMMAGLAERSLDRAIKGLLQRDDDLCTHAIADDEEIDQLEKQIDKDGFEILLRYQPVASDLRRVISAIKLSPNIERVGDQATNIAEDAVYAAAAEDIRHKSLAASV